MSKSLGAGSSSVRRPIFFDLVGTCTNWLPSVRSAIEAAPALPSLLPQSEIDGFALEWRSRFLRELQVRWEAGQSVEDIDVTYRRSLNFLLVKRGITARHWDDGVRVQLVASWHEQAAWNDIISAMSRLGEQFDLIVLAEGSLRYQLTVINSAKLHFHAILSPDILGKRKTEVGLYRKAIEFLQIPPSQAFMVSSCAQDLRVSKQAGIRTVYVCRSTEDLGEDQAQVRAEQDFYLDGRQDVAGKSSGGGLGDLADILGAA